MKIQSLNSSISQLTYSIESLEIDVKFISIASEYREKYRISTTVDENELREIHIEKAFKKDIKKSLMEKMFILQEIKKEQTILTDELNYEMLKELVFPPVICTSL